MDIWLWIVGVTVGFAILSLHCDKRLWLHSLVVLVTAAFYLASRFAMKMVVGGGSSEGDLGSAFGIDVIVDCCDFCTLSGHVLSVIALTVETIRLRLGKKK